MFDWTVNIGQVIAVLTFVAVLFAGMRKMMKRMDDLEFKMQIVWKWFERRFDRNGE